MKTMYIPLTRGKVAVIDRRDYKLVSCFKWRAIRGRWRDTWYAMAHTPMVNGKRNSIQMHRLILDAPRGVKVDHVDFDGLNNRRSNLRLVTNRQSSIHTRKPLFMNGKPTSSKFKGVSLDKRHGTWKAQIRVKNRSRWLGQFKTQEAAALAYDKAAQRYHGHFAVPNLTQ